MQTQNGHQHQSRPRGLHRRGPVLTGRGMTLTLTAAPFQSPLSFDDPDDVDHEDQIHGHDHDDQDAQKPDAVPGVHPTAESTV